MIVCNICGEETKYSRIEDFQRWHLQRLHNILPKEYYDKYSKSDYEGKCYCGKDTKFQNLNAGYSKYCSASCSRKDPEVAKKISDKCKTRDYEAVNKKIKATMLKRYGVEHAKQSDQFKEKSRQTQIERYGYVKDFSNKEQKANALKHYKENINEINERRDKSYYSNEDKKACASKKRRETTLNKYGHINISGVEIFKEKIEKTMKESGRWFNEKQKNEFQTYVSKVISESRKHYPELFQSWDGRCYYTNEILISNEEYLINHVGDLSSNKMQPTVDHKISKFYGFKHNIPPEEIGALDNLCICSRKINASKGSKIESEFRKVLNNEQQY